MPNLTTIPVTQLQTMLNTVVLAIGNPTLRARGPDGCEVQYRSMDEALKAKGVLEDLIREASGVPSRVSLATHRRGEPALPGWPRPGGNW
jgi:hypothetical protein